MCFIKSRLDTILITVCQCNVTVSTKFGATHEARTRDLNLGKVALYQLS
jgi:hypothetical protein